MAEEKLNISWDDLQTRRVDNRLREQSAMERNRSYAQMQEDALPAASASSRPGLLSNALVAMTLFGLIGGVLAWTAAMIVGGPLKPAIGSLLHYQPDAERQSQKLLADIQAIDLGCVTGRYSAAQAKAAIDEVIAQNRDNPYFVIAVDLEKTKAARDALPEATTAAEIARRDADLKVLADKQKRSAARLADQKSEDNRSAFLISTLSYGLCGMMIAACLGVAEPLTQRKNRAALIYGSTSAVVGLVGGAAAALLNEKLSDSLLGSVAHGQADWIRQLLAQSLTWGILGLCVGLGSGVALLNPKRLAVGMLGGLVGGLIGGALFEPVQMLIRNQEVGRLAALIAIGVVAGLGIALLENAVKAGWLKVTSGIIAGKQFILYRNPTYIGSSPDCQIYLFKDPQVGRRHAAIHLLPSGIEIEDLPLGGATLINGKPVSRAGLKSGDTIQIGATSFEFQEKRPVAGK